MGVFLIWNARANAARVQVAYEIAASLKGQEVVTQAVGGPVRFGFAQYHDHGVTACLAARAKELTYAEPF